VGQIFEIGVSIGLVPLESDTLSVTDALSAADRACYIAKEQGRNKVHAFQADDALLAERHGEMLWIARLASAFREKRFQLYCQPIRPIDTSARQHSEVLLRMLDERGELVLPGAFMAAAERYDQVGHLDRWVVENSLMLLNGRQNTAATSHGGESGVLPPVYCINLSGTSLGDKGLLLFIEDKIEQYQIDPGSICFEITETAVVRNLVQAKHLMATLRKLGCQFALDDFGSGLSSFSYLKNFPVDYLKIDGAFVKDIAKDPVSRAMVESINHVGHVMGLKTIAEYVEDEAVLVVCQREFAVFIAV
jgi:EAL domain-containing protein (putative c-di-GMP-specific phosphodiesterase class I)